MVTARRIDAQIIGDILRLGEAGKTAIAFEANLSYWQLERYLGLLLRRGFVQRTEGGRVPVYRVTAEGRQLLDTIDTVTRCPGFAAIDEA